MNVPVCVQGVWIRPGDWLYADEDGVVVSDRNLLVDAPPPACQVATKPL